MANVLTDLAADIYRAADIVGREQVGIIPSVLINAGSERAALNDTVRAAFTRQPTLRTTYAPSMTIPEGDDQTVDNKTLVIDKVANIQIPWTGEDIRSVNNGAGFETIYGDQIAQAMRRITNAIEVSLWGEVYKNASRAIGTPATTPFGSNFNEVAEVRKILVDNGTPMDGQVTMAINSTAGTKLRNLAQLQSVNTSGGDTLLRQGTLLDLQGLMVKESAGIGLHVRGTANANFDTNLGATLPVGSTVIAVDTGTGTILAGDVVTFAGDPNQYVVTSALAGGSFTIAAPGLRQTLADGVDVTVLAAYTGNVAFHRNAIELAARAPQQPFGGDAAVDRMTVQDPFSGLTYEIAVYKGYNKTMIDVTTLYGHKAWKPEFIAGLLG
jgi:hypothetical protein